MQKVSYLSYSIKYAADLLRDRAFRDNGSELTSRAMLDWQSCIEDLFPSKRRSVKLKGKKFSTKSKTDPKKEYGKEVFAKPVVKPNAEKIDFSGFDPLLERVLAVLTHHAGKKA